MKEEEITPSKPEKSAAAGTKPAPIEGSCHFFIERKKRYCRFRPAKESNFCAEHRTAFQVLKVIAFTLCIMLRNCAFFLIVCNLFFRIKFIKNLCGISSKCQEN